MRLALGTVQFGLPYGIANSQGQVPVSEAARMLRLARESQIDTLDTAIAYGESERRLGEIGAGDFRLVTKLPAVPAGCADVGAWMEEQFSASLARLNCNAVHGLLLHRPEQLLESQGAAIYRALLELKDAGRVRKIGISIYDPALLTGLYSRYPIDLLQAPFNLVDRRLATSSWMQRLKDEGVEIHVRSAFLQGLLLLPAGAVPGKFAPWSEIWTRWQDWLASTRLSAVQACLGYALSFPAIDRVVVGADSVGQLQQIIQAANSTAPAEWPDLQCSEEDLINPARWGSL